MDITGETLWLLPKFAHKNLFNPHIIPKIIPKIHGRTKPINSQKVM